MKKSRKKYERPRQPWDKERIEREKNLIKTFGLKKKQEIWRTEALVRKYRRIARDLAAKKDRERERQLLEKLIQMGLLSGTPSLDDALGLTLENMLERRLQTIIFKKGLANSPKQARQFITHGKVLISGRKIVYPSYIVRKEEESVIQVTAVPQKPKVNANG